MKLDVISRNSRAIGVSNLVLWDGCFFSVEKVATDGLSSRVGNIRRSIPA